MIDTKPRDINPYQDYIDTILPPVSSYFDYNKANTEIAEQPKVNQAQEIYQPTQPPAPPSKEKIMEDIYSDLPKPKYDQARQDRMKKLAKYNTMGQGLQALGDIFALSQGAMVNKRQDTGENQRLYAMFQGYEDDYARRMDDHNRQEFNLRLQKLINDRAEGWRKAEWDHRERESARQQANTDRQFSAMELDREERREDRRYGRELQEEGRKMERERLDWEKQRPFIDQKHRMEQLDQRNKNAISQYEAKAKINPRGGITLYDEANNPVHELDKGQTSRLLQYILNDPVTKQLAQGDIALMRAQFGDGMNTNTINNIVAFYWDKSPDAKKFLGGIGKAQTGNSYIDQLRGGVYSPPKPQTQQQENKNKEPQNISESKIDYTSINY